MGATRKTEDDELFNKRHDYYLKNKERILAKAKVDYLKHREKKLAISKKLRADLKMDRLREKRRAFYESRGEPEPITRIETAREFVQQYKGSRPCLDCDKSFPFYVMDFDHVQGEKTSDISTMVAKGKSISKIKEEIAKCDLVCANCHRERSFQRQ